MKTQFRFLLLILILALFFPSTAQAALLLQVRPGIYFDSTLVIQNGERVSGDLLLFGGQLTVEEGGVLDGDLLAFGTSLDLNGTIRGDVFIFGGDLTLGEQVQIEGDLMVDRTILYPSAKELPVISLFSPFAFLKASHLSPLVSTFKALGSSLLLAFLAFLVALFLERQLRASVQVLVTQPLIAGGLGLLTILVVPLAALVLIVTLIFIPVAFLLLVGLLLLLLFGWIALGMAIGQRVADFFGRQWRLPFSAALGTFLLTLLAAIFDQVPCVGWLPGFLAAVLALGAVLISLSPPRQAA